MRSVPRAGGVSPQRPQHAARKNTSSCRRAVNESVPVKGKERNETRRAAGKKSNWKTSSKTKQKKSLRTEQRSRNGQNKWWVQNIKVIFDAWATDKEKWWWLPPSRTENTTTRRRTKYSKRCRRDIYQDSEHLLAREVRLSQLVRMITTLPTPHKLFSSLLLFLTQNFPRQQNRTDDGLTGQVWIEWKLQQAAAELKIWNTLH